MMAEFIGSVQEEQGWEDHSVLVFTRRVADYLVRVESAGFDRKWTWAWARFDPTVEQSRQFMQSMGYANTRNEAMAFAVDSIGQRLAQELERVRKDIGR